MENLTVKRKPTINLSLFTTLSGSFSSDVNKSPNSTNKSFRNFQDGVVGLGIVAAMTDLTNKTCEANLMVVSPRSTPVPIVSSAKAAANFRGGGLSDMERDGEVDEFSESYTCVISHLGNNLIEKRVYYDNMVNGVDDDYCSSCVVTGIDVGLFSASPVNLGEARREFEASDFLSSCYLCNKKLHGLDIFMYRGEKAFCSSECRDKQIRSDDYKEKCGSKALKPIDYSVSPCSTSPLVFFAGVAAA